MKKPTILAVTVLGIISLIVLQIYIDADKHVVVVKDNATLTNENTKLESDNTKLRKDNVSLKKQVTSLTKEVSSLEKTNLELVNKPKVANTQLGKTKKQPTNESTNSISVSGGSRFDFKPINLPDSADY